MKTGRLRTIQQPSQAEALLESFVWSVNILPDGACTVRDRSELPGVLQRLAINAKKNDKAWGARTDNHRLWFFAAEMSLALSRERRRPVLQVDAYGEDASYWSPHAGSRCWMESGDAAVEARGTMSKPPKKLKGRPATDARGNSTWQWSGERETPVDTASVKALSGGLSLEPPAEAASLDPYNQPTSQGKEKAPHRSLDDMRRLGEAMKREHEDRVKHLRKWTPKKIK